MSLDGKILRNAISVLQERRSAREAALIRRKDYIYKKLPRIRQIDEQLRDTMLDIIAIALKKGGEHVAELEEIQERNLSLQGERADVLKSAGYPEDYIDERPLCDKCGDTGFIRGKRCSCLMDIYKKLQSEELSSLIKLGEETFETFSLDYYDNAARDPATGETARQNMEYNRDLCRSYASGFGKNVMNLLLIGGTGLGKTFLSTCIAKVVSEKGFSVVYDTAVSIFAKFEDKQFHRAYGGSESDPTERYFKCDLLIIDDLGTEVSTSFRTSFLYDLINSRLISGRQTLINSNLSIGELGSRYSEQIRSRIEGYYTVLSFYGQDIRSIKNTV